MDAVIEQHPDKKILIIEKEQYNNLDAVVADVVLAPSWSLGDVRSIRTNGTSLCPLNVRDVGSEVTLRN